MTKLRIAGLALAVATVWLMVAGDALAADKKERAKPKGPRKTRVVGTVKATKEKVKVGGEEQEKITAVSLSTSKGTEIAVAIDEGQGMQLGEQLDGKKAMATGTWKKDGDKRVLVVESFKEAVDKKPRKPKKEPADDTL